MIDPSHPEAFCQRCKRRNISWSVASDRWNAATEGGPEDWTRGAILCPACFVILHERVTGMTASWDLVPATPFRWE